MAASRRILLIKQAIDAGMIPDAAWSYFNTVGQVYLAEPAGADGGAYFNRA